MRNVEAITAMGMLPGVARLLSDEQSHAKTAQLSAGARASAIQALARFIRFLAQVLVMAVASYLVIRHDVSPAAIFAASILLGRSLGPVEGAIGTWKAVTNVRLAYDRIRRVDAGRASAGEGHGTADAERPSRGRAADLCAAWLDRAHRAATVDDGLCRKGARRRRAFGRRKVDARPPDCGNRSADGRACAA